MLFKIFIFVSLVLELFGASNWAQSLDIFIADKFFQNSINGNYAESSLFKDLEIFPIPTKNPEFIAPQIQARSAIIIDRGSSKILFQKNALAKIAPASLTKLLTALVVLDNVKLDDLVTISKNATQQEEYKMGLLEGEEIEVRELLAGLLIRSANDAAIALGEFVAKRRKEEFSSLLNEKAKNLELKNSHFTNPAGFDEPLCFSTAEDLARLANFAFRNKIIADFVVRKTYNAISADGRFSHFFKNTNDLLWSPYEVVGGKTGFTEEAGENLVVFAKDGKNEIIVLVLGSPDRFQETKALIDWTFRAYRW